MTSIFRIANSAIVAIGLAGTAVLSGCADKTFVQSGHSLSQLATVTADLGAGAAGSDTDGRSLTFTNLDGEKLTSDFLLGGGPSELQITSGKHVVWVVYRHRTLVLSPRFEIDLRAGIHYRLHEGLENGSPQFWLTESGSTTRIPMEYLRY